jgi:uncharacterized LabA/DUF88 family protein
MRKTAIALIDYDNLDFRYRSNHASLEHEIYNKITTIDIFDEIVLRFYGGWFDNFNNSISAVTLAPWVHTFPKSINKTILSAELARSLAFENHHLPWTFRRRTRKTNISIDPNQICANNSNCDLYKLDNILKKSKCQTSTCSKEFKDAILVNEQKLVDSMISIDLLHFAQVGSQTIVLISSDDDFIPAIRWASHKGYQIYVLHTKNAGHRFKSEYTLNFDHMIKQGGMTV